MRGRMTTAMPPPMSTMTIITRIAKSMTRTSHHTPLDSNHIPTGGRDTDYPLLAKAVGMGGPPSTIPVTIPRGMH